jgi:hypothetical protein
MHLAISRGHRGDPGGWLRRPSETFALTTTVTFSADELWVIRAHNLYRHIILDRTPSWYFSALQDAIRQKERMEKEGVVFEWPQHLPPSIPDEWIMAVEHLLRCPQYVVTFRSAYELSQFEPRLRAAFTEFKRFLDTYGSRPTTSYWRL